MKSTAPLAKTGTDVERLLLAAGADEGPDEESVRRAAAVLGVVPHAALVAATLGAAQGASRAGRWVSLFTWGPASVAGVAAIALVVHVARPVPNAAVVGALVARTAAVPDAVPMPAVPTLAGSPASPLLSARAVAPTGGPAMEAHSPVRSLPSATPGGADPLREQAQLLDAARTLLALGDAPAALARLGDYDRRFPAGSLREEAQLLRIEALAREGDRGAASALARGFLRTYPESVHAARVAALLQEPARPKAP